jgi:hypothetical protein
MYYAIGRKKQALYPGCAELEHTDQSKVGPVQCCEATDGKVVQDDLPKSLDLVIPFAAFRYS